MQPSTKSQTAIPTPRREGQGGAPDAVRKAAHEALQQALDRRDNGGETGH